MYTIKPIVILSFAFSLALSPVATAQTVNGNGERVAFVSYADLNLRNSAGVGKLHERIRRAIRNVCGYGDSGLQHATAAAKCRRAATAQSGKQVAALTAKVEVAAAPVVARTAAR
jgi:UrcA family protein